MSEKEAFGRINTPDGKYETNQENTSIFRHLGKYAMYDHIFVNVTAQDGREAGIYVWNHMQGYEALATPAVQNECTIHLNLRQVADIDKKAYDKHQLEYAKKELEEFEIPDDWN